jgi:hypothetical protein
MFGSQARIIIFNNFFSLTHMYIVIDNQKPNGTKQFTKIINYRIYPIEFYDIDVE